MRPMVKWSLIGCGCLSAGTFALVTLVLVFGVVAAGREAQPKVTTVGTATPSSAKPAAQVAAPAKPAEKPALPVAKVGDRVESAGVAITVNSVNRADQVGQFMKAKPGRIYVVVNVQIESPGRDKAPYNPLYFKIRDGDGYEYSGSLIGPDNALQSGELAQGERVRGTVSFDVPSEAKGMVLSYQPIVLFGGYQTIRVQLD